MTAYLFDSDAIAEAIRRPPNARFVEWLGTLAREEQFTAAAAMADLYGGAGRSPSPDVHAREIEERVLPAVTVLPFDAAVARVFARLRAGEPGDHLSVARLEVAATALYHDLQVVTSQAGAFRRVAGLRVHPLPRPRTRKRD